MCSDELFLSGTQHYSLSVKTSNDVFAATKSPIYIEFIGTKDRSPKKLLTETGFNRGEDREVTIQTKDVGEVYGIVLSMYKEDDWGPDEIVVKRSSKEVATFASKGQSIKCPLQCSLTIMNAKPGSEETDAEADQKKNESADASSQTEEDINNDGTGGQGASESAAAAAAAGGDSFNNDKNTLENGYQGNGLSGEEFKNLIELKCEDKLKDNEHFGPQFSNNNVNFEPYIAICPHDCWKQGATSVFGLGIHPEEASICRSAIVDRSMPLTGGVIGIGVTHGLNDYQKAPNYADLEIRAHKVSKRSFFTYKVDNVDFMESDMRILDNKGFPSAVGRLEFRKNGIWGSVCSKKMTQSAAQRVCRQLKYQDGTLKSLSVDSTGDNHFCRSFKGDDFCAPDPNPIHYMALNCDGMEGNDIMKCYREIAQKCTHDEDAIIECTNTNYETSQDPHPGTVRLVDYVGSPAAESNGRLEVYMGQWGSVCNSKFTDKAAHVACRQMGFLTGKVMGSPGETGFCSKYKGKNYCGNQQISLSEVDCKGDEENIKSCGGTSTVSGCNHEQDIIVSCEGSNGDTSGRSQLPHPEVFAPQLGKLPLLPIVTAKCDTKSNEQIFRGDPGSIFLVNCPSNCETTGGIIWGTGIYTSDSAICRAAIHTGVIHDEGGLVEIIRQPGLSEYFATKHNSIDSTPYKAWASSFTVTRPNSLAIKLSQSINGKEKVTGQKTLSFLEMSEKNLLSKSMGSTKPVFSWFPPVANFEFDGKETKIKTQGVNGVEKTKTLTSSLAIATRITSKSSSGKQETIVSHSACGGFAMLIKDNHELSFGERCNENMWGTGYYVPVNEAVSIVVNYDGASVDLYVNGKLFNRRKIKFNFKLEQNLDIGSYEENSEFFKGAISYALFYDGPLPLNKIKKLALKSPTEQNKGKKLKNVFTLDNRLCLSDCTNNPIPGSPGAAAPPACARANQGDYPTGDVNEGMGENEGKDPNSNTVADEVSKEEEKKVEEVNEAGTNQLKCEATATEKEFEGVTGKFFRVNCPKNCAHHPEGNVFGNLIYSDDSSICKSAIHAGFIKNEEGGEFLVEIANGVEKYDSSFKNEINSAARGANTRSFVLKEATPLVKISCEETGASSKFVGPANSKFTVMCPPECSKVDSKVYGNDVFTDDSSVCQAAIYAGVLTDKGGEVSFLISEGQSAYKGGVKNGIKSLSRETYIRSMSFLGSSRTTCHYFKETYADLSVLKNWKIVNANGLSTNKPGAWSFVANPTGAGLNFKQSNDVMGSEYNYGTSLLSKIFSCGEGVYSVNVYMEQARQAAILFRYSDENNFYAVELNQVGENKMKLVKKSQGTGTVLKVKPLAVEPKEWYRFVISFHLDNLQVYVQKGALRELELIFNATDSDNQIGSVGFAAQGNSEVFFDGVETKEYDPKFGIFNKKTKESRVWDQCLTGGEEEGHRKKFCKGIYGSYTEGRKRCEDLHNFCEICCDRTIPKEENILNYACWRGCVRVVVIL